MWVSYDGLFVYILFIVLFNKWHFSDMLATFPATVRIHIHIRRHARTHARLQRQTHQVNAVQIQAVQMVSFDSNLTRKIITKFHIHSHTETRTHAHTHTHTHTYLLLLHLLSAINSMHYSLFYIAINWYFCIFSVAIIHVSI